MCQTAIAGDGRLPHCALKQDKKRRRKSAKVGKAAETQ
jgi:hypothetical protein